MNTGLSILQLIIMIFYVVDTVLAISTFGLRYQLWHFVRFSEFLLIIAIFVMAIIELSQDVKGTVPNIRTQQFFLRLAKFYLIARKISVAWMNLENIVLLKSYDKEVIILEDILQSQSGMINMLQFIQKKFVKREDCKLYKDLSHTVKIVQKQLGISENTVNDALEK